jgi:HlyD family secretion protein
MTGGSSVELLRDIRILFESGTASGLTDRQLLERFIHHRDPSAFEVLVLRHGPMVLRVCRNLLHDPNDAQDAFQATFLILVRRSGSIRRLDSVGSWLYGVACRAAARLRVGSARRRTVEQRAASRVLEAVVPPEEGEPEREELGPIVQEEVRRLPEKYRAAVVLCYWEGLTQEQAAAQLGCPLGTVRSRLARGRDLLRRRLTRRGIEPMAVGFESIRRLPPLAPELVRSTVQAAAGQLVNPVVSAAVASLFRRMLWRTTMIKLGGVAAGVMLVGLAGYGAGAGAQQSGSIPPQGQAKTHGKPGLREPERTPANESVLFIVENPTTILAVVASGSEVKKGNVLVELDPSALRDQLVNQRITTKSAEATYRDAKLTRENADHTLTAYQSDLFPREEQEAKGEVDVAERELAVAQGQLDLYGGGGLGPEQAKLNFKRYELDVARAKLALEKARNRLHILTQYTKEKQTQDLVQAVKKSLSDELARMANWKQEKTNEQKLERQIAACTIVSPGDGTVIHGLAAGQAVFGRIGLKIVPPPDADPDRR